MPARLPINPSCRPPLPARKLRRLMAVAAGREPADIVLTHINLVNVNGPQVEENTALAMCGDRVAAIGPNLDHIIGPKTQVMGGGGRFCLPGMIDAHTHLDSIFSVRAFARLALASGNTTVATEMAMIANAAGEEGLKGFMAEASNIPMRVFFLVPPLVPPFPHLETSAGLDLKAFKNLLRRADVLGVGEMYWRPALDLPDWIMDRLAAARRIGKRLEGHAAGARHWNLQAYRAGGITSCHESTSPEEALERLGLGMAVHLREGFVRCELPAMGPLAARKNVDFRGVTLSTDLATPEMLLQTGVMNELVRRAVAIGFDPLQAIQMVTLNPAEYFGLSDLGRITPGALADLVLVDNIQDLKVDLVMVGAKVVASQGLLTVDIPDFEYPEEMYRSFKLTKVTPADFRLSAPTGPVKVRAVAIANATITKEEVVETRAVAGRIASDPAQDLLKVAVFNKHSFKPQGALGLARGLGLKSGAVATSLIWDTNNVFCAGVTDEEMANAVNRLLKLQGGMVVVEGKKVLAELPMPVGGVISTKSFPDLMEETVAVEKAVHGLGCPIPRPFLTLQTFCFTGLPFLRLTDKGLVDVRKGEIVPLMV